ARYRGRAASGRPCRRRTARQPAVPFPIAIASGRRAHAKPPPAARRIAVCRQPKGRRAARGGRLFIHYVFPFARNFRAAAASSFLVAAASSPSAFVVSAGPRLRAPQPRKDLIPERQAPFNRESRSRRSCLYSPRRGSAANKTVLF